MQEYFVFFCHPTAPIEETFNYIKYFLQDHDDLMQATDNPVNIIQSAFDNITKEQCLGWINDCGYI